MKKNILSTVVTLFAVFLFVAYFLFNKEDFSALTAVSPHLLVLIALFTAAGFAVNALFLKWTTEVFTRKISLPESTYVVIISSAGNFFGPFLSGAAVRGVYLKKKYKLSYSNFTSTLAGYYLMVFAVNNSLALLALFSIRTGWNAQSTTLAVFFAMWLVLMILFMFIRVPKKLAGRAGKGRLLSKLAAIFVDIESGWRRILKTDRLLLKMTTLAVLSFVVMFIISTVEFRALSIDVSLAGIVIYTALATSSLLINITPGAIGIREGILLAGASVIGISPAEVMQMALLDRTMMFMVLSFSYLLTSAYRHKKSEAPGS